MKSWRTVPVSCALAFGAKISRWRVYDIELPNVSFIPQTTNAEGIPTLESVTEIQRNTQSYPFTALLGLRALATDTPARGAAQCHR